MLNSVLQVSQGRSEEVKHLGRGSGSFGISVTNHPKASNSPRRSPITGHHTEVGCPARALVAAFVLLSAGTLSPSVSPSFWSKACALVYTGVGKGFHIDLVLGAEQPCMPFKWVA